MRIILSIALILQLILLPVISFADTENIDEMMNRRSRIETATWDKSCFEDPTTLVWQPETFTYIDIITGHEVTKINASVNIKNSLPDIGWAHYSADGKRFSFGSHRDTNANDSGLETNPNSTYQGAVMLMRTDGTFLRPADNAPFEVYAHSRYLHWSPVDPDVYYGFGRNSASEGCNEDDLYKVTVSDTSIAKTMVLDLDVGTEVVLKKGFSSDGKIISATTSDNFYIITLSPSVSIEDADGWAARRQLDNYWGGTPADTEYTLHDKYLIGKASNALLYVMAEGYSGWWRYALSGSAADGGPLHVIDNTAPYDWGGEIEPEITGFASGGNCLDGFRSPWNCDSDPGTGPEQYISHPGFDRWGKYVVGINSQQHQGWGVWNLEDHAWLDSNIPAPHYDWHTNWSAWSDYIIASPASTAHDDMIYALKMNSTDTYPFVNSHIRETLSTDYNSLPRVSQSPDGTKAVYHSDFLNSVANNWDLFQVVVYYPYAPEITTTSATAGTATIRFDWQNTLADPNPRTYTTRGWPSETTDDRPIPRETEKYRLWRSTDKSTWTPISTIDANHFTRFDFADGGFKAGQDSFWEITDTPGDGTFYYAVTSIEHSGLESKTLSNIFAVTIASGSGTGAEDTAYPADPGGNGNITATYNSDMVRYYNIYYEKDTEPTIDQTNRIASIPVGSGKSWIDWLGHTDGTGKYLVTAVDTMGNESEALETTSVYQQAPAIADGQYTVTWVDAISPTEPAGSVSVLNTGTPIQSLNTGTPWQVGN